MFYDPASTLRLPDEVTCAHIIAMVERAQKYFSGENAIVKDSFIFADPESFEMGDRGGYTDSVTSGGGDFLTTDTLWDFKVSMSKPTKTHTLQVLMHFLMGKQSGLPEFENLTHIGLFNPRLGHRAPDGCGRCAGARHRDCSSRCDRTCVMSVKTVELQH